jgi:hypothetical protein
VRLAFCPPSLFSITIALNVGTHHLAMAFIPDSTPSGGRSASPAT